MKRGSVILLLILWAIFRTREWEQPDYEARAWADQHR